jgi:hypothetical protein
MAVDGIGGSKPPGALPGVGSTPPRATSGEGFDLQANASASTGKAADFERLQQGEISREEYLSARVQQAVSHLEGVVPVERLELIKAQLLEQMQGNDPVLNELLKRATGHAESEQG